MSNLSIKQSSYFPLILVISFVFSLTVYIGYSELHVSSKPFEASKLNTLLDVIENQVTPQLKVNLDLEQITGFIQLAESIFHADNAIHEVSLLNTEGVAIFQKVHKSNVSPQAPPKNQPSIIINGTSETEDILTVTRKIHGQLEHIGYIRISSDKHILSERINKQFDPVTKLAAFLLILYGISLLFIFRRNFSFKNIKIFLYGSYIFALGIISIAICYVSFQVYSTGAKSSSLILAESIGERIQYILDLGVDLEDISNIDLLFKQARENRKDIASITLQSGNTIIAMDGNGHSFNEYNQDDYIHIEKPLDSQQDTSLLVKIKIPKDFIYQNVLSSVKAILVLMIACILMSKIFFNAAISLITPDETDDYCKKTASRGQVSHLLNLIKPGYYSIVFVNTLSISFLPQLVLEIASSEGSNYSASLPFTLYYLFFALTLLPAVNVSEAIGLKKTMIVGFVLESIALLLLALPNQYFLLIVARCLSGIGQGFFLIGLQSYILEITPTKHLDLGQKVKVNSRNAALICGAAIGALLYSYIDYKTIFLISSLLGLIAIAYIYFIIHIPLNTISEKHHKSAMLSNVIDVLSNIPISLKDRDFSSLLILVGISSKILVTGLIMFLTPILLDNRSFKPVDIGFTLMIFYISSLLAAQLTTTRVNMAGFAKALLFLSTTISGLVCIIFGFLTTDQNTLTNILPISGVHNFIQYLEQPTYLYGSTLTDVALLICIVVLGLANGIINLATMIYLNHTESVHKLGKGRTVATYLFLERLGHAAGPFLFLFSMSQLDGNTISISLAGCVIALCGIIFYLIPSLICFRRKNI